MIDTSLFSTSLKKIGLADYGLRRKHGWTTNNFWIFKTEYEPKRLQVLKGLETNLPLKAIGNVINPASRATEEVFFENDVRVVGDYFIVRARKEGKKKEEYSSWINASFLAFFRNIFSRSSIAFKVYQEKPDTPFYFKQLGVVIGCIMPVRHDDDYSNY